MAEGQNTEGPTSPSDLRKKATHYRRLAVYITDPQTVDALMTLAAEFEAMADRLEHAQRGEPLPP